jgi:hypothetical protein
VEVVHMSQVQEEGCPVIWLEDLRSESDDGIVSRGSVEVLRAVGPHGIVKGLRPSNFQHPSAQEE